MSGVPKPKRLYTVEFLRVWFILCIIMCHVCTSANPSIVRSDLGQLLHSSGLALWRATDFFFLIGGFFLYRRITQGTTDAFGLIKKIYFRLLPVTLFTLVVLLSLGTINPANIPFALAQLNGTGLSTANVIGYGDWFIGVYFWTSCLFIGLLQINSKHRWLWIIALIYVGLILKLRNTVDSTNGVGAGLTLYSGLISDGFVQGISFMGIGMLSAFGADKLEYSPKSIFKIIFTFIEIICLVNIYKYMFDTKACKMSSLNLLLMMGCFMISITHSLGYISTILNKASAIKYISRYTLPALYGHIICFYILKRFHNFDWGEYPRAFFIICGGIVIGMIEYHLIERWFVSKIRTWHLS